MDFTLSVYNRLIQTLLSADYSFATFKNFILSRGNHEGKSLIILRHDVEKLPQNALKIAEIERSLNIRSSYYFRISTGSYNPPIMQKIAAMGHEIGYHYDDVETTFWQIKRSRFHRKIEENALIDAAYKNFCCNLQKMRDVIEIKTICMHGSPLSKFDNRILWNKYDYRTLGIIGEPYFDIDWKKTAYLTDTGRRWNGCSVSVRDKVNSNFNPNYKSTFQVISHVSELPVCVMLNLHTHRWFDPGIMWFNELVSQNFKNTIKYLIVRSQ